MVGGAAGQPSRGFLGVVVIPPVLAFLQGSCFMGESVSCAAMPTGAECGAGAAAMLSKLLCWFQGAPASWLAPLSCLLIITTLTFAPADTSSLHELHSVNFIAVLGRLICHACAPCCPKTPRLLALGPPRSALCCLHCPSDGVAAAPCMASQTDAYTTHNTHHTATLLRSPAAPPALAPKKLKFQWQYSVCPPLPRKHEARD